MHFIVFGAGAVGSMVGARLQQSGQPVLMVGRPAAVEAMSAGRFTLVTPSGSMAVHLPATTSLTAEDIRSDSAVILCVKSQHVARAAAELRQVAPPSLPIVCLQNGVRAESLVQALFPRVYSALNVSSAIYAREGQVYTAYDPPAAAWFEIGVYPSGIDEVCRSVAHHLRIAGFVALCNAKVQPLKYGKLLGNLGNAIRAIASRQVPSVAEWARMEAEEILHQAGLSFAPRVELEDRGLYLSQVARNEISTINLGSTWQSLTRGVDTEVDYLNGEIVRVAEACRRSAPINQLLVEIVHTMEREHLSPGFMMADELEARCLACRNGATPELSATDYRESPAAAGPLADALDAPSPAALGSPVKGTT